MQPNSQLRGILRADPSVRRVIASWRRLTGGTPVRDDHRRTLIACSGGADSCALALALAAASNQCLLVYIKHDMRPESAVGAEQFAVARLAAMLELPFASRRVQCAHAAGNLEANARRLRYEQLALVAAEHNCPFIATGHQADDQLETMLMRLIRGASLRSLAGIRERRPCHEVTLVRPMLQLTRAESEHICRLARWSFAHDQTNDDTTRTRARLRHEVLPQLRSLRADAARQSVAVASSLAGIQAVVDDSVASLMATSRHDAGALVFRRDDLRAIRPALAAEVIMAVHTHLAGGSAPPRRAEVNGAVDSIRGDVPSPRLHHAGGIQIRVTHATVAFSPASSEPRSPRP